MSSFPGLLVAFEGIDGAGKTTQARRLEESLRTNSVPVVRTREPTDGQHGAILRASAATGRLPVEEELRLFLADRREHVDTLLLPHLRAGSVVIVDRYYFSSIAYQGSRGLDPSHVRAENEAFAPQPDLLVYLRIDPVAGLRRVTARSGAGNHFEQEETLRRVATVFDTLDDPFLVRLDGTLSEEVLAADILSHVLALRSRRSSG